MTANEKWLELRRRIYQELDQSEGVLLKGYPYNIRDGFPFGKIVRWTLEKVLDMMEEMEEK